MSDRGVLKVDKGYFKTKDDVVRDMLKTGFWPTTHISLTSPELPVHWHDGDIIGYVMSGSTYILDGDSNKIQLEAGDRLVIPEGALHAEGEVTETVTYIVTLGRCEPYMNALRMLDPETYPTPDMLALDPELVTKLMSSVA